MGSAAAEIKNLEELLNNKIDGKILDKTITRLTANGENFCSLMLKLDLVVQKNGTKKTVHTVAKCLTPVLKVLSFTMINEFQWYANIMNIFKEFQKENGYENIADFFPEMIAGRLSLDASKNDYVDDNAVLILENLISKGYVNEDRYIGFDLPHSKSILKRLATFAAVFIGLKLKKPQIFQEQVKKYLKELPPPPEHDNGGKNKEKTNEILDCLCKAIEENPGGAPLLNRVKPILDMDFFQREAEITEPWATVCHSDFWMNNIMVKNEAGKEPKVKFVDYQMCRYRSFACDVVFFMLTSVRTDVQKQHFEDLLRYYYDEFTKNLTQLNLNLDLTYPAYLEELKRAAKNTEIQHAIMFSTIVFGEKNSEHDHVTDPDFDPPSHMLATVKNMSQLQKNKIVLMSVLSEKMGWLD